MEVCHSCDNTLCVNPGHLFTATHKQNMEDCVDKKRLRQQKQTHCVHGHEFDTGNTAIANNGQRVCRACKRLATRRRRGSYT